MVTYLLLRIGEMGWEFKISQWVWTELWPLPLCSLVEVLIEIFYLQGKWSIFHIIFFGLLQAHLAIWAPCVLIILLIYVSDSWQLQFIPSEFRGQLPKPFAEGPLSTRLVPTDMNDQNLEEPSRYVRTTFFLLLLQKEFYPKVCWHTC